MTTRPDAKLPGARLLEIARLIFDPEVLATVVHPTIADLQREMNEAGPLRGRRLIARWRGYRAFWTVVLVAPLAFWRSPVKRLAGLSFVDLVERVAVSLIAATLLQLAWQVLGAWTIAAAMVLGFAAVTIHKWYERHPGHVGTDTDQPRRPEINLSAIHVRANAGGLIFVVGSVLIIMLGLPMLRWFLFAGTAAGVLLACALLLWHAIHPFDATPRNRVVHR